MNIDHAIDSVAFVENAGGPHYLTFPYVSSLGLVTEPLSVRVPIHGAEPSANDKKALAEAIGVQGALGVWEVRASGEVWLVPKD